MQAYRNFKMKYNSSSGHQSSRSSSLCWRSFRSILYSNFTRNRWFHFSTLAVIFYFLTIHSSPPWIPLFQSKALPNETSSTQSLDISLDALLLSSAPTNKPDSDLVDPDGSIKPDNEEDRPYPLKVNGKLKQDPRNVPSSAVTPMPILPDDFENRKPLEEEDNADDGNQEDSEQPINEEEEDEFINEEVESIKSFEPTKKNKGVGYNKKKSSWNDNKFKNQFPFKYSSKNKKVIIDEEQPKEEEDEPAELLIRSEIGDEEQS